MKAEELEPVKGTCAARKRATEQVTKRERQFEEALPFLSSRGEALVVELGAYEEDSEKENQDVGEGSSDGVLCPIVYIPSSEPIPAPPPKKKPFLTKVTEDLRCSFKEGRQKFLSGEGVPWLEHELERYTPEPHVERSGIRYVSVSDVDKFIDHVVGHL